MPTVFPLLTDLTPQFFTSAQQFASGYKLFVYQAGTSTKATTYQTSAGTTANTNPVILNSRGETPYGVYVESGSYKLVLAPDTDTDPPTSAIRTQDNIPALNDISTTVTQFVDSGFTPTYLSATTFSVPGDKRSSFETGRRIETENTGGTAFHTVSSAAFSTDTTVTVVNDSTTLDAGLSSVKLGILRADNSAIPHAQVSSSGVDFDAGKLLVGGSAVATTAAGGAAYPPGHLKGISTSSAADTQHDVTFAAGSARDEANALNITASAITKQIDANWAEGTDAGGFPSGLTLAADTWYRLFSIVKTDGTADAGFDTSATAANLLTDASAYTGYRRVGWRLTDSSSNLHQVLQYGREFRWKSPDDIALSYDASPATDTAVLVTAAAPPNTRAIIRLYLGNGSDYDGIRLIITPTDVDDISPPNAATPLSDAHSAIALSGATTLSSFRYVIPYYEIQLDSSSQFRIRASNNRPVQIATLGWHDDCGRD